MRVGVVGAGLQAGRRLAVLGPEDTVVAICAPDPAAAQRLTGRYGGRPLSDWKQLIDEPGLDAVLVTTPPDRHEEITVAALAAGKHVLCEKPLASSSAAALRMEQAAASAGRVLYCAFNHRFHPALVELAAVVRDQRFGRSLSALAVYGHAVRAGYTGEWRADPSVVSGGQLMEQGIHAVDLIDALLWPVTDVVAHTQQLFGLPPGIEDDAHLMLRAADGRVAYLRSSLSEWRNRFLLEVTCEQAVVRVDGLGGSYGEETLTIDERTDGPFSSRVIRFRGGDRSWTDEWAYFRALTAAAPVPPPDPAGRRALRIVEAAYASRRTGHWTAVQGEDT